MHAGQRLGADEDLVRKPTAGQPEQELVAAKEKAVEPRRFHRQRKRGRDAARLDHLVAGLLQQLGQRGESEQAAVSAVEDAAAAVVELPE